MNKRDMVDLAVAALNESAGDPTKARKLLFDWITENTKQTDLSEGALWLAAESLVREPAHIARSTFWEQVGRTGGDDANDRKAEAGRQRAAHGKRLKSRLGAVAKQRVMNWLDEFKLAGNVRLGDADAAMLYENAKYAEINERTNARNKRFYLTLAQSIERRGGGVMRDTFSNEEIQRLAQAIGFGEIGGVAA